MEMRPKSMATVVVTFPGTARVSSTPSPAEVIIASVVNGVISETEPTSVVLPTPNPPAMTIFADVTRPVVGRCAMSEPAKSTQHPLQQFCAHRVVAVEGGGFVHRDHAVRGHVSDKNPGHPERQLHPCGDLSERLQSSIAQRGDVLLLTPVAGAVARDGATAPDGGFNERFERDIQPRPGTPAGDGIRSHQSSPRFVAFGRHRRHLLFLPSTAVRVPV